jgi:hypothetical protein
MDRHRRGCGTSSCLPADSSSIHLRHVVGRNSLLHHLAAVYPSEGRVGRATDAGGIARDPSVVGNHHSSRGHSREPTLWNVAEIIDATRKFIHEGPAAPPTWVASLPVVGGRLASYLESASREQC